MCAAWHKDCNIHIVWHASCDVHIIESHQANMSNACTSFRHWIVHPKLLKSFICEVYMHDDNDTWSCIVMDDFGRSRLSLIKRFATALLLKHRHKEIFEAFRNSCVIFDYDVTWADLGHHWFRQWLVASLGSNHYLNQCWQIDNLTRNIFRWHFAWKINIFHSRNIFQKAIWGGHMSWPRFVNLFQKLA